MGGENISLTVVLFSLHSWIVACYAVQQLFSYIQPCPHRLYCLHDIVKFSNYLHNVNTFTHLLHGYSWPFDYYTHLMIIGGLEWRPSGKHLMILEGVLSGSFAPGKVWWYVRGCKHGLITTLKNQWIVCRRFPRAGFGLGTNLSAWWHLLVACQLQEESPGTGAMWIGLQAKLGLGHTEIINPQIKDCIESWCSGSTIIASYAVQAGPVSKQQLRVFKQDFNELR